MKKAEKGDFVKVHYTGKLDDGQIFDSSEGGQPLEFQLGSGQVIPGFEEAITGMAVNEKKSFRIPAEDAYGERDERLTQSFARSELPPNFEPQLGQVLSLTTHDNQTVYATVTDVNDEAITLDLNHFLAGKALNFDVELVEISDQPSQGGCGCGCSC
ncbi:peptidylprolyl isomerase [Desulfacinum infernum DSM 9756]|jgi:peptidylprolyl isomerase|uniref:Peptidyl-prolyl cis-trans isomerase n=1 Tax=Desulfacinum infernum DSM 9756 TaxID=1121391 RepID=A0A1M4TSR6_9BACT|nr:peptidylprolyl isomerase [Desulfacinum sp.]MBZ4660590.1 peptidylprolyl isomerase [Desulfacinum sp.]SHE47493.1 peptidylprolyl isomerase [Desulfacinum infernum DSM 9756]